MNLLRVPNIRSFSASEDNNSFKTFWGSCIMLVKKNLCGFEKLADMPLLHDYTKARNMLLIRRVRGTGWNRKMLLMFCPKPLDVLSKTS